MLNCRLKAALALGVLLVLVCSTAMATEFKMETIEGGIPEGKGCPLKADAKDVQDVFNNKLVCGSTDVVDTKGERMKNITDAVTAASEILKSFDFGDKKTITAADVSACTFLKAGLNASIKDAHFALFVATAPTTVAQKGAQCVFEEQLDSAPAGGDNSTPTNGANSTPADGANSTPTEGDNKAADPIPAVNEVISAARVSKETAAGPEKVKTYLKRPLVGAINIPLRSAASEKLKANVLTAVLDALNIKVDCTDPKTFTVKLGDTGSKVDCHGDTEGTNSSTFTNSNAYSASPITFKCPLREKLCVTPDTEIKPEDGESKKPEDSDATFPAAISSMHVFVSAAAIALAAFAAML